MILLMRINRMSMNCEKLGAAWIQFDEPFLVHDLTNDDIALFHKIYKELLKCKGSIKVLVTDIFWRYKRLL